MTEKEAYVAFNLTEQVGSVKVGGCVAEVGAVGAAWGDCPKEGSRAGGEGDWQNECRRARRFGVEVRTPADDD